jgi:outer membrane cobalamin receptor
LSNNFNFMKRILFSIILLSSYCFSQETDSLSLQHNIQPDSTVVSKAKIKMSTIDDVVLTGTIKPFSRSKSPVAVEVYSQKFFQKNPTPSIFEAIAMVNGVKPQLNCSVCNTGDIHINGLEGPYTMILIDGMPIVSSLSTVYGLSGIPNSLVDRIEVVKGPASSIYGSEAMGGVINIITKNALTAPKLSVDMMTAHVLKINGTYADVTALVTKDAHETLFNKGTVIMNISNYSYTMNKDYQYYKGSLEEIARLIESETITAPNYKTIGNLSLDTVLKAHSILKNNQTQGHKLIMKH